MPTPVNVLNLPLSAQIGNVVDPTSAQQAATKNYVDTNRRLDRLTDVGVVEAAALDQQVLYYHNSTGAGDTSQWRAKTISVKPATDATMANISGLTVTNTATAGSDDQKYALAVNPSKVTVNTQMVNKGIAVDSTGVSAALLAQDNTQYVVDGSGNPLSYYTINAGRNITASITGGVLTLDAAGGGGGGGLSAVSTWGTSNSASKNARNAGSAAGQGSVNSQIVTLNYTATFGQTGTPPTVTRIIFRGTNTAGTSFAKTLTNTYTATGTFPTYTVSVPVADIFAIDATNDIQLSPTVSLEVSGMYDTASYDFQGLVLTNVQPIPATTPTLAAPQVVLPARSAFVTKTTTTVTGTVTNTAGTNLTYNWSASNPTSTSTTNIATWMRDASQTAVAVSVSGTVDGSLGAQTQIPYGPLTASAGVTEPKYYPAFARAATDNTNPFTATYVPGSLSTDQPYNRAPAVGDTYTYNQPTGGSMWIAIPNIAGVSANPKFTTSFFGLTYAANPDMTSTVSWTDADGVSQSYNVFGFISGSIASTSNPQQGAVFTIASLV